MTAFDLGLGDPGRGAEPSGLARSARCAGLAALLLALAACGGGGGGADGVATPSASSDSSASASAFTQGTITGFGSIIVNGVRFDDSAASVTDDAGNPSTSSALRLGMRVDVDSGAIDSASATAKAGAVRYGSLVLGPVASVDAAAGTLTVLGQVADISASTVFSDSLSGGLSAVLPGAVLEVHGLVDAATGHITATRVDSATGAAAYKLRGTVAALDANAKTFRINGAAISYAGLAAAAVPSTLANGVSLRVLLSTVQSGGLWVAQSLGVKPVRDGQPADGQAALVRGSISAFSSASSFSVDGLAVDASHAVFPDGSAGLALGVQVEVLGKVVNGVLVAGRVSLETPHQGDDSHRIQLFGAIMAMDATAKTFVLRNVTVRYGDATTYINGSLADLAVGRKVHVKGGVGSTRTQVQASEITFE